MEITVESVSNLERKMTVTVPASEITPKVEERIKQAASQARIKGLDLEKSQSEKYAGGLVRGFCRRSPVK